MARSARAALGAAFLLVAAAPGASAGTFLVDDDKAECPNAGYTSIGAALTDAATSSDPDDAVVVCRGVYEQSGALQATGPLTLRGAGAGLVRIEASAPISGYLLHATGPGSVDISGVTLAAGADDTPPNPVDGGIRWEGTGGSLRASRLTDLGLTSRGVLGEGGAGADYTVAGSVVEGYGPAGLAFEGGTGALGVTVSDSVIQGRGPQNADPQDGILVSRLSAPTATATISGNLITDNRYTPDEAQAAGVRFRNATAGSAVNDNDIQGNGYGVFNGDGADCDAATADVDALRNWWGDPDGPTMQTRAGCPPALPFLPVTGSPVQGDRISGHVNGASSARMMPREAPVVPAQPVDNPPTITGVSPADGTEAEPGSPVSVSAAVTDDFDVKAVQFRRGTTVVKTDTQPPYDAAITAPAAGQSQSVLVTAVDTADQTDAEAISLRGKAPPAEPVTPQQPQQPAEPEDRPPSVAFTAPGEGTAISPSAPPRMSADASDDRGVARVAFLDDGKVICTDEVAPYDCAYQPTGEDVGRDTLIAIAQDGAGQTAVAFRGVTVQRFDPKLTARTTPKRDRRRPYRYATTGSLVLPAGVTPEQACTAGGSVTIEFRVAKLRLPQTATLKPDCSFKSSIAFPSRRPLGNGRIAVSAKFGGNTVLGTAKAPSQKVRAG